MPDAKDILKRLAERERNFRNREFLAPYTNDSQSAVVKMDGLSYRFRIFGFNRRGLGGIGVFRPTDPTRAVYEREAPDDLRRQYLDILPQVNLILCYATEYGWVAYPMNVAAAKKQIGLEAEVLVKNVTDAEVFDVVTTRFDGTNFWFDQTAPGSDAIKSDAIRQCFNPEYSEQKMRNEFGDLKGVTPEDRVAFDLALESWKTFRRGLTEERLKEVLSLGGGKLVKYVLRGNNLQVEWKSESGRIYESVVNRDSLAVISSGICLDPHDGTGPQDGKFHLKDLPFVMKEGEHKNRIVIRRNIDMTGED